MQSLSSHLHPGIVRFEESFDVGGRTVIVMERLHMTLLQVWAAMGTTPAHFSYTNILYL